MPAQRYAEVARAGARGGGRSRGGGRGGMTSGRGGGTTGGHGSGRTGQVAAEAAARKTAPAPLPHDARFVFPFAVAVNREVTAELKDGSEYEGIFHGPALGEKDLHIVLNNARKTRNGKGENGLLPGEVVRSIVIRAIDFVQLKVKGVPTDLVVNGSAANGGHGNDVAEDGELIVEMEENGAEGMAFDGDRGRQKGQKELVDRELVQWDGGPDEELCILEDAKDKRPFDQFKGTNNNFKWDSYTSKLDPSKSRYSVAEATRIAEEIERDDGGKNVHVATERGQRAAFDDSGLDEETLFSAVADPPKKVGVQPPKPEKKPLSWADAVKGKGSRMGPAKEGQTTQPSQPSTPPGVRWGPKPVSTEQEAEEPSSMKTMSLPSSMIARNRRSAQDQSQGSGELKPSERVVGEENRDAPCASPSEVKSPKGVQNSRGETLGKESVVEIKSNQNGETKASQGGSRQGNGTGSPKTGLQPGRSAKDWGDSASNNDRFFDKPDISAQPKSNLNSDAKMMNHRQVDKSMEAKKPQVAPTNVWKSKGSPWNKTAVNSSTGEVPKASAVSTPPTLSPQVTEQQKAPNVSREQPVSRVTDTSTSKVNSTTEVTSAVVKSPEVSQKKAAWNGQEPCPRESQRQAEASGTPDAGPQQATHAPEAKQSVQGNVRDPVVRPRSVPSPLAQTNPTTAPRTSSLIQPGVSWSQIVKESAAKPQVQKKAPAVQKPPPGVKPRQGSMGSDPVPSAQPTPGVQGQGRAEKDVPVASPSKSHNPHRIDSASGANDLADGKKNRTAVPAPDSSCGRNQPIVNDHKAADIEDMQPQSPDIPAPDTGSTSAAPEQCSVSEPPSNSAAVAGAPDANSINSCDERVEEEPLQPPPPPPARAPTSRPAPRSHSHSNSSQHGGHHVHRQEHGRRSQWEGKESQLNPHAPPYQLPPQPRGRNPNEQRHPSPMYAAYPYQMYDQYRYMPMMPHPGAVYPPHCPPRERMMDSAQMPPGGIQQPPMPSHIPVPGPGVMGPPFQTSGPPPPEGQEHHHHNSSVADRQPGPPAPHSASTPSPDAAAAEENKAPGQDQDSEAAGQGQGWGNVSVKSLWSSIPGGEVWHSDQQPMHNGQMAMMNGCMPGSYPMWPGVHHPGPYFPGGAQQDPAMWARAMGPMHIMDPRLVYGGGPYGQPSPGRYRSYRSGHNSHRGRNSGRDSRRTRDGGDGMPMRNNGGGRMG